MTPEPADDLERLRAQLRQALEQVRIAPGSEVDTVRAAHRRTWLRRGLAGATAVTAVAAGGLAAARIDRSDPGAVATRADGAVEKVATESTVAAIPSVAPLPPTTVPAPSATLLASIESALEFVPVEYPALVPVDPPLSWAEVAPGPEANPPSEWSGRVPGVVVATNPDGWAAYYTADGIAFQPLRVMPPSVPLVEPVGDGDGIYSVGAEQPTGADQAVALDVSADRGTTWTSARLPIDATPELASDHVSITVDVQLAVTNAGPLVIATERVEFDQRGFPQFGGGRNAVTGRDGVQVFEPACGTSAPSEPVTTIALCEPASYTWEQLGLSSAEAAALERGPHARAFRWDGAAAVEVELPPGTVTMSALGDGLFVRSARDPSGEMVEDPSAWRLGADARWTEVEVAPDLAPFGAVPRAVGGATLVVGANADSPTPVFAASTVDGWTYATTDGLFGEHAVPYVDHAVTTPHLLVAAFGAPIDLLAADGGVEVESAGVVLRRESAEGEWLVLAAADRSPIAGATLDWEREAGGVAVLGGNGEALAEFDPAAIQPLIAPQSEPRWSIVTTADGLHVAVEPVADLLGVAEDSIAGVRLNAAGDSVIATVTLGDTRRILVGTPLD